jgi:biopolymer transport protein ExbD
MSAGGGGQQVGGSKFGRGGAAHQKEVVLNLTPMIDLMTILVVYLVMSFSADPAIMANSKDIELSGVKITTEKPKELSVMSLSKDMLLLDGKPICPVIINPKDGYPDFPDSVWSGFFISPLKDALDKVKENAQAIEKINPSKPFKGEIILHADRRIPFATIKPVLRSAGNAGFRQIKIAAKGIN